MLHALKLACLNYQSSNIILPSGEQASRRKISALQQDLLK